MRFKRGSVPPAAELNIYLSKLFGLRLGREVLVEKLGRADWKDVRKVRDDWLGCLFRLPGPPWGAFGRLKFSGFERCWPWVCRGCLWKGLLGCGWSVDWSPSFLEGCRF